MPGLSRLASLNCVYYEGCRQVVERYFALEDKVRTLHQEVVGRVRVAAIYSVGLHLMSRYLKQFMSQHPKANVRLEYLHPDRGATLIQTAHVLMRYDERWGQWATQLRSRGKSGSVVAAAVANRWVRWLYHQMQDIHPQEVAA